MDFYGSTGTIEEDVLVLLVTDRKLMVGRPIFNKVHIFYILGENTRTKLFHVVLAIHLEK